MARSQQVKVKRPSRGVLARPLEALVFLLPLIVFYQFAAGSVPENRVIAYEFLNRFFLLFGDIGTWAAALTVVVILLATHAASGERWAVRPKKVLFMHAEAVLWAAPLYFLHPLIQLAGAGGEGRHWFGEAALSVGAGIYEELIFRLLLVSLIMMVGADLLHRSRSSTAAVAVLLSALAFALHHHPPIGGEPFALAPFVFRFIAGIYLAGIFWYRGYGPAAGCHAAYNLAVIAFS